MRSTDDLVEEYLSKANPSLPPNPSQDGPDDSGEEPSDKPGDAMAGSDDAEQSQGKGQITKLPPPSVHESAANLHAALSKISHLGEKGFRSLHPGTQKELLDAGMIDASGYLTAQGHQEVAQYFAAHAGNPKLGPEAQQHASIRNQAHSEAASQGEGAHEHWKMKQAEMKNGNGGPPQPGMAPPQPGMPPKPPMAGPGQPPGAPPMAGKPPMPPQAGGPPQGAPGGAQLQAATAQGTKLAPPAGSQAPGAKTVPPAGHGAPVSLSAPNQAPENVPPNEGAPTARGMVGKPPMAPAKPANAMAPPHAPQAPNPAMPAQPMPPAGQPGVPPPKPGMPPKPPMAKSMAGLDELGDYLEKATGGERSGHKYIKREGVPGHYSYTYTLRGDQTTSSHAFEAQHHANSQQLAATPNVQKFHETMESAHVHFLEGTGHNAKGRSGIAAKYFDQAHRLFQEAQKNPSAMHLQDLDEHIADARQASKFTSDSHERKQKERAAAKVESPKMGFPHRLGVHILKNPTGNYSFVGTGIPGELVYVKKDGSKLSEQDLKNANIAGPAMAGLRTRVFASEAEAKEAAAKLKVEAVGDTDVYGKDVTPEKKEEADRAADATWKVQHGTGTTNHGQALQEHGMASRNAHEDWKRLTLAGKARTDPEVLAASSKAQYHAAMQDYHLGMKFANEATDEKERASHKEFATKRQLEANRHEAEMGVQQDLMARRSPPAAPIGKTSSGKTVHGLGHEGYTALRDIGHDWTGAQHGKQMRAEHKDFTGTDHYDAARLHEQERDKNPGQGAQHHLAAMAHHGAAKLIDAENDAKAGISPKAKEARISGELLHGTHGPLKDLMHNQTYLMAHQAAVRSGQDFFRAVHEGKGVGGIGQALQEKHQRHLDKLKGIAGKHGHDVRRAAMEGVAGEVKQYNEGLKAGSKPKNEVEAGVERAGKAPKANEYSGHPDAQKYIRAMRNPRKKAYAQAYAKWKDGGEEGPEPEHKPLSYMAAQAVRLHLGNIVKPRQKMEGISGFQTPVKTASGETKPEAAPKAKAKGKAPVETEKELGKVAKRGADKGRFLEVKHVDIRDHGDHYTVHPPADYMGHDVTKQKFNTSAEAQDAAQGIFRNATVSVTPYHSPFMKPKEETPKAKPPKPVQGDLFAKKSMSGISELGDYLRKSAEQIPGGLASGKSPKDFDAKALAAGIKVEMEHTGKRAVAQEIAMDHLTEDPRYYEKLARMEKSDGKADAAITELLQRNPRPDDSQVHALAGKLGMEVDDLEERIYAMAAKAKAVEKCMKKSEGEGSRGGHVIGHSSGGKPIYESHAQVRQAFQAHNSGKESATFNEGYNSHKKLGSANGRALMEKIANSKYGGGARAFGSAPGGPSRKIKWEDVEAHTSHLSNIERVKEQHGGVMPGDPGRSEKSMSGLNHLSDYLEKADGMPDKSDWDDIDKPAEQTLGGSANGGDLTDHPGTSGNGTSGPGEGQDEKGQITGVPEGQQEILGDDRDPAKQMTPGTAALQDELPEGYKSLTPAAQREMVAKEHAMKVAQLQKSTDVSVGSPHPLSMQTIHGNTDAEAEALLKSDFYYGASPTLAQPGSVLRQSVLCKSEGCGCKYSAMLTACPACGSGTTVSRMLPRSAYLGGGDAVRLEKSAFDPILKPAPVDADVSIPGPSPVVFRRR